MGFRRAFALLLAIQIFVFIQHRAVLHKDCTEHNDIQKIKTWQLSHSDGGMIEYGKSHCYEIKPLET